MLSLPESAAVKPMMTQYSQKSRNSLCIRGFGFLIGGRRRKSTAITGIKTPKLPAELDAFRAPKNVAMFKGERIATCRVTSPRARILKKFAKIYRFFFNLAIFY